MRAVVLRRQGGPEELRLEEVPEPRPGPDDVLVAVKAAAVCYRDLIDRRGGVPMSRFPTILGHEFAGVVEKLGERAAEVSGLAVGDRVINLHRPYCAACAPCLAGQPLQCDQAWQRFGHTIDGAYAEKVAAPHKALVKLPDGIPFDHASTLVCTAGVALHALRERGRLSLGETVLITGATGGVGTAAVQIARAMGARVVATTTSEAKVEALKKIGAHQVLITREGRFDQDIKKLSGGGVELCIEITGRPTFASSIRALRPGGRMVVVGNIDTTKIDLNLGALILYGYEIVGSASCNRRDLIDVLSLALNKQLLPQIDRRLPLDQAAEAHRILDSRGVVGRIVLEPER
jgi:NADPH:quinone reductase-like Zn-dependent oxidoreductase